MLLFLDKIKRVMHSCSLQLEITMFGVALSYLHSVISITHDDCVKTVTNSQTCLPSQSGYNPTHVWLFCLHVSLFWFQHSRTFDSILSLQHFTHCQCTQRTFCPDMDVLSIWRVEAFSPTRACVQTQLLEMYAFSVMQFTCDKHGEAQQREKYFVTQL